MSLRSTLAFAFLLLAPTAALAQKTEREVFREGSFVVVSDMDMAPEKAKAIVARVKAAYDFDSERLEWTDKEVLAREIRVRAVSDARMKEVNKKAKGLSIGKDELVIAASFLDEERSSRTLAHELTHLQDRRHLDAKGAKLPHWFNEAHAISLGRAYETKLGILDAKYDSEIARVASDVSPAEAKRILEDDAYTVEKKLPSVFRMEAVGFFFLEFLRVKLQVDGVEARLAKVVARVGKGATLEDAFAAEVGKKLADVRTAFYEFLDKTKGAERLEGTALAKAPPR